MLAGFARGGDATGFETVAAEIGDLGMRIRGLDSGLAVDAAWLRGEGIALEDAVHVATARARTVEHADVFVTHDCRPRSPPAGS